MNAELTQEHTKTGESCTKAGGLSCIPKLLRRTGKKNTKMSGLSVQNPNCPSGSANAQARNPENQNLPMMMKKEVRHQQLKKKKRKRKKRKRRKKRNKSFMHCLNLQTKWKTWSFSRDVFKYISF